MLVEKLKAARFYKPRTALKIEEIQEPKLDAEDVLVKIKACGICGSDIHIYKGETPVGKLPITLGHEFSGVVVKVGSAVKDLQKGERVCVDGLIFCGKCKNCISGRDNVCKYWKFYGIHEDGGFAEYCKVHAVNCIKLPNNVPFDQGAILTDAVATPYHAVRLAKISVGDIIAIYGIGGLGINAVQLAKLCGARVIAVDVIEEKLKWAKEVGADNSINAAEEDSLKKILELTDGEGVDIAIEMVGKVQTLKNTFESVRRGGKAVLVGLCANDFPLDTRSIVRKEIEVLGSYSYCKRDIERVVKLATNKELNLAKSITHKLHLEEVNKGIEILDGRLENPLRVIIQVS